MTEDTSDEPITAVTVHGMRHGDTQGHVHRVDVDIEWDRGRGWYRFEINEPPDEIGVISSRDVPRRFNVCCTWAVSRLHSVVGRLAAGEAMTFPIEILDEPFGAAAASATPSDGDGSGDRRRRG